MKSKKTYEIMLNTIGVPEAEKKSNGGRVKDNVLYGSWLRRNDPIQFEVCHNEYVGKLRECIRK